MLRKILVFILTLFILAQCTSCTRTAIESTLTSDAGSRDINTLSITENTSLNNYDPTERKTEQVIKQTDTVINSMPPKDASSDDITAIIDKNLDIITKDNKNFYTEQQFIDAHPAEFAEIVALGEEALPYLKIISTSNHGFIGEPDMDYRGIIAMAAAYKINPELYDLVYPSPDGKYALKAYVVSFSGIIDHFGGIKYKVGIINYETGSIIISSDDIFSDFSVEWSPDSKYAAISQGYRHYVHIINVFDIKNANYIYLSNVQEVEDQIGKRLSYNEWINVLFYFNEWSNDKIKIQIALSQGNGGSLDRGWYIYDFNKHEIVDYRIIDMADETATLINKNLDILAAGYNDDNYDEVAAAQEAVVAHPNEFDQIIQLGETALPYLAYLKNTRTTDNFPYKTMAAYAEYVIKPELYDISFPSLDRKYTIKASKIFSSWPEEICDYNNIRLIEYSTGKVICHSDIVCRNIKVDWSPSKPYAVLSHGISGYSRDAVIVDILNAEFIILPGIFEIKQLIADKDISAKQLELYEKYVFVLGDWLAEDKTKIQIVFVFDNPTHSEVVSGRYVYDLSNNKITYIEAAIDSHNNNPAIPDP